MMLLASEMEEGPAESGKGGEQTLPWSFQKEPAPTRCRVLASGL